MRTCEFSLLRAARDTGDVRKKPVWWSGTNPGIASMFESEKVINTVASCGSSIPTLASRDFHWHPQSSTAVRSLLTDCQAQLLRAAVEL